jgi:ATP-dependent DNA helicase Rep
MLVGVTEGLLPFKLGDDDNPNAYADGPISEGVLKRLQEERRLMYVGITRAKCSLAVSWTQRRKKGREMVVAQPSRLIAEMALEPASTQEVPRAKLKALLAEFAQKAPDAAHASAARAA